MLMYWIKAGRSSQSRATTKSSMPWGRTESVARSRSMWVEASMSQSKTSRWFLVSMQGARSGLLWWSTAQAQTGAQYGSWCD